MKQESICTILGWKTDPVRGPTVNFEKSESSHPSSDVNEALNLGSHFVLVEVAREEDVAMLKENHTRMFADYSPRDESGRYFDPPPKDGILTFQVEGHVPTGRLHPIDGRRLHRIAFRAEVSTNPGLDVERALGLICTSVSVGVNHEISEEEKLEDEADEMREREAKKKHEEFLKWESLLKSTVLFPGERMSVGGPGSVEQPFQLSGYLMLTDRRILMVGKPGPLFGLTPSFEVVLPRIAHAVAGEPSSRLLSLGFADCDPQGRKHRQQVR